VYEIFIDPFTMLMYAYETVRNIAKYSISSFTFYHKGNFRPDGIALDEKMKVAKQIQFIIALKPT